MRQFIVLGYASNSDKVLGQPLYLGADRSAGIAEANAPTGHTRKELYELAVPQIRRHFDATPAKKTKNADKPAK